MEPCLSYSFQATDEDSPPNNQITYSIVNASSFGSYFDISVYEGYGGAWGQDRGPSGRWVGRGVLGCMLTPLRTVALCLPDTLNYSGSCPTAPVGWSST